jgi:hypothetical protein
LVLPVVLSACTTYGRQAESAAIDQATSSARETAAHVQQSLLAELRTQPLADTLKSLPDSFPSGVVTVVDSSHDSAGGFTARLAIIGSGEGSGGSFQAQAAVLRVVQRRHRAERPGRRGGRGLSGGTADLRQRHAGRAERDARQMMPFGSGEPA